MNMSDERHWYYSRDGENRLGPMTRDELISAFKQGDLTHNDLVWNPGLSDWVSAGSVTELELETKVSTPPPIPPRNSGQKEINDPVDALRAAAEAGDSEQQFKLAKMLYNEGFSAVQDQDEAAEWYRKAAEQGHAEAQLSLSSLYLRGVGVEHSWVESANWVRKAAENGNLRAMFGMGHLYRDGQGVQQDPVESLRWFERAAEQGYACAQLQLWQMYSDGDVVKQDQPEATKWFSLACAQNDSDAQCMLAGLYIEGKRVPRDYKAAIKWLRMAAEQGDAEAQYQLGNLLNGQYGGSILEDIHEFMDIRDPDESIKWLRRAKDQGHRYASFALQAAYKLGQATPREGVDEQPAGPQPSGCSAVVLLVVMLTAALMLMR
jgi:uncharacterized protein